MIYYLVSSLSLSLS